MVPIDPAQTQLQAQMLKSWEVDGTFTSWRVVVSTWLARVAGGFHPTHYHCVSEAKTLELLDLLQGELATQQVVVFFRFNAELRHVARAFQRHGIAAQTITGETPPELRERRRRLFVRGQVRVMLCQVKCVRMGLDFSTADTAIYYSNGYSLEDRIQSEDRLVHPAKAVPLLYLDLVTEGTVDEDVVSALRRKHLRSGAFLSQVFAEFVKRTEGGLRA
jgi:hypothetical protein